LFLPRSMTRTRMIYMVMQFKCSLPQTHDS
jgi:hypothetical protein